jgi:hypothetical protein
LPGAPSLNEISHPPNSPVIVTIMSRIWPYIPCLVVTVITTACAPLPTVEVSEIRPGEALVPHASRAKVLEAKEVANRPCEYIGIVSAIGDPIMAHPLAPRATSWRALRYMRKVAGKIGADALVDYRAGERPPPWSFSHRSWASAIAVRFLDSPSAQKQTNQIGIVLIARPEADAADTDIALVLARAARYYLAEKGYFPVISEQSQPTETTKPVAESNTPISASVFPPEAEFVLFLRLKHRESKMLRTENGYLEGVLVEKSSGATVWSFPPDVQKGIRLVDFQNLDRIHGDHAILCDLFHTLPDRTTRSFTSF